MQKLRVGPVSGPIILLLITTLISFDSFLVQPSARLVGEADPAALSLWHVWWPQFGLHQADTLPINAYSGAPYLSNHLGYLPLLQSTLFALLQLSGQPVLAFNLILIFSQVATFAAMYLFLTSKDVPRLLAGLGAAAFVLSPWYYAALSRADVIAVGLWLMPLSLLAWDSWLDRPTPGRAALVVVGLYAALLCGIQHVAWIVALWLPYAIWTGTPLWSPSAGPHDGDRPSIDRDQLLAMGFVLTILVLIYPAPNLVRSLQGNEPAFAGALDAERTSTLLGSLLGAGSAVWLSAGLTLALQQPLREANFWLVIGGVCVVFALGLLPEPAQMVAGMLGVQYLPLYDKSIFFAPALFATIAFACVGWRKTWEDWTVARRPWVLGVGAGIFAITLAGNLAALRPLPGQRVPTYPFYESIAQEPEDYLLLNYPFGLLNTQDGQALGRGAYLSEYAVWHHKRTVGGIAPYYEMTIHADFAGMDFLFPDALTEDDVGDAAIELGRAVDEWRIGYVVVHADLLSAAERETIQSMARLSESLCPPVERDGLIIYRANWHPSGCGRE